MGDSNKSGWIQAAVTGGSGLLGTLISGVFNKKAAERNLGYNKQLMQLQNQYDIEAFNRENARQDFLMQNAPAITKQALRQAGYSTADPNATGVQTPSTNNQDVPTATTGEFMHAPQVPDFLGAYQALASAQLSKSNAKLAASQARLNDIEAGKRGDEIQARIDQARANVQQIQELLPGMKDKLVAEVDNLKAQKELNDQQALVAQKQIEQLSELIKGIQIDNSYKGEINASQIQKNQADAYAAWQSGNYQKIVAGLAKDGIFVNGSILGQVAAAMHQGQLTAGNVLSSFGNIIGLGDPDSGASAVKSALDTWIFQPLGDLYRKHMARAAAKRDRQPNESMEEKQKSWVSNPN